MRAVSEVAPHASGLIALGAAALCWGSTVVLITFAARGLPTVTITLIEVAAATMLIGVLLVLRGVRLSPPSWALVLAGVLEPGAAYPLINAGLARTSGAHAAVIIGLESVFIVVLSSARHRSLPRGRVWAALALAAVGAALVGDDGGAGASLTGDGLIAAGVLIAAAYVVVVQEQIAGFHVLVLSFYQFLFGLAAIGGVTCVVAVAGQGPRSWTGSASGSHILAAVLAGVLGSAVAFVFYNAALAKVSTASAATSLGLIPVFGVALSAIFLANPITVITVFASVLVLAGVALSAHADTPASMDTVPDVDPASGREI